MASPEAEAKERRPSSSSSSSFETTSSSSESSIEDETMLRMLSHVHVIYDLLHDVEITDESPITVRNCDEPTVEHRSGNKLMALYRAISTSFLGSNSPSSPEWFLLTAFVLNGVPTHYSVWKERRDIILNPTRLLNSTQDILVSEKKAKKEVLCTDLMAVAREWLPLRKDLESAKGVFSNWRAVRWELNAVIGFNMKFQKNFQVWHHRRELLETILSQMEPALSSTVLTSMDCFSQFLLTHHDMEFIDIDERIISSMALEVDSKNYHVWLHRLWFIRAFPFLLGFPSWEELKQPFGFIKNTSYTDGDSLQNFVAEEEWENICLTSTLPPCALNEEILYTARLIKKDCLNNSAWCHRFSLFNHDFIHALVQTNPSVSPCELKEVLYQLCVEELYYALQWCAYNPSNESPFVHARAVASIYQATSLRLHLSNASPKAEYNYLSEEGPIVGVTPLSSYYLSLKERILWEDYLSSFSLLQQQISVLREVVAPRAENLLSRMAAPDEETVNTLYSCSSQFLLDNLHQVYAAVYHSLFGMLEQVWCCYFTEDERKCVHDSLPSNTYNGGLSAVSTQRTQKPTEGCIKFFLDSEEQAVELAGSLVHKDSIRSKYWKNEIRIVIHREYSN